MSKCSYENCANSGTFDEENCPGSDDDDDDFSQHHCFHCGELWWIDKGVYCVICEKYFCPSYWQNNGKVGCENCKWYNYNYYCSNECFTKHMSIFKH